LLAQQERYWIFPYPGYQPLADGITVMLPYDQKRHDDGFELIPDEQSA